MSNVSEFKRKSKAPEKSGVTFYEDISEVINKHGINMSLPAIVGTLELVKHEVISNQFNKEVH